MRFALSPSTHARITCGRREAGRAIMEYLIGKAVERSMQVSGNYKELTQVLE
jgi:hypothetical protein